MPSSFENPFIQKPDDLKPDAAEFLRKYAGASDEQLRKAGVSDAHESLAQEIDGVEGASHLKQAASDEEKEAYYNELIEFGGVNMCRGDLLAIQSVIRQLNIDLRATRQDEVILSEGNWKMSDNRIEIDHNGILRAIHLSNTPISSLDKVRLPINLSELDLYKTPIHSLDNVNLPANLRTLNISGTKISSLDKVTLPYWLRKLVAGDTPIASLRNVALPKGLHELSIWGSQVSSLDDVELPEGLLELFLINTPIDSLNNVILPKSLRRLDLRETAISSLDQVKLPEELEMLNLNKTPLANDGDAIRSLKTKYPNCDIQY